MIEIFWIGKQMRIKTIFLSTVICFPAFGQTVYGMQNEPTVSSNTLTALPTGQVQSTIGMSNGTTLSSVTSSAVNSLEVASYEINGAAASLNPPVLANGGNVQASQGIAIEELQYSGLLGSLTVDAPQSPTNGQLFRVALLSGLTVTALTIKSYAGVAGVDSATAVVLGFSRLYRYGSYCNCWVRIE